MLRSRQHAHANDKESHILELSSTHSVDVLDMTDGASSRMAASTSATELTTPTAAGERHQGLHHRPSPPTALSPTMTATAGNLVDMKDRMPEMNSNKTSQSSSSSTKVSMWMSTITSKILGNRRGKAGGGTVSPPTIPGTATTTAAPSSKKEGGGFGGGTVPLKGYVTLLTAFLAISTSGTALDLQGTEVHPCMKVYWRLSATSLALIPLVIYSLHKDGPPRLTFRQWMLFPICAIAYSEMTTSFVTSLSLTSMANAFVFSNMTSLILLLVNTALGRPTLRLEVIGVIIGFGGALICSCDNSRHSSAVGHDSISQKRIGDLLALSASFGMAAYLSIAKDLRSKCNLFVFTFALFVCCQFFILSFMIVKGEPVEFSTDKNIGIFGWVNSDMDRLPVELYIVLVCSLMGTIAYVAVLQYFEAIVVAVVMLMEPSVAALIGYMAGVDSLPGLQTWFGDAFVVAGSTMVIYCGATKDTKKQQPKQTNRIDSPTKDRHESLPHIHTHVHDQ